MILGVGVDIVDVRRIAAAIKRNPRFTSRILTEEEQEEGMSAQSVAARWAAKEAVAKAVGTHLTWQQVRIIKEGARPMALVVGLPANEKVWVSLSHEKHFAVATAIYEQLDS